jgi:rhodanese-related sulfurtransferase
LKKKNKALITYCRSGMRSSNAKAILEQAGLKAYNGGGFASLSQRISQGG